MTAPGGFAMVPAWLAWKQPSANALLVYVHLALHGTFNMGEGTYEQCRPSKRTLAKGDPKRGYPGTGFSEQTVGRALRELEALGAIRGEVSYNASGAQLPTVYRVQYGRLAEAPAPPATDGPGPAAGKPAGRTPVSPVIRGGVSPVIPPPYQERYPPRITGDTQPISSYLEPKTKTPTSCSGRPAPAAPPAAVEEEEAPGPGMENPTPADAVLQDLVAAVPAERRPRPWETSGLRARIEARLTAGWGRLALVEYLADDLASARSVAAVLLTRLDGLPAEPPQGRRRGVPAQAPPPREEPACKATGCTGWVGPDLDRACPTCRPKLVAAAKVRADAMAGPGPNMRPR